MFEVFVGLTLFFSIILIRGANLDGLKNHSKSNAKKNLTKRELK